MPGLYFRFVLFRLSRRIILSVLYQNDRFVVSITETALCFNIFCPKIYPGDVLLLLLRFPKSENIDGSGIFRADEPEGKKRDTGESVWI